MSQQPSDYLKAVGIQTGHQPNVSTDANIDLMLQSLMIDDTDVKKILKGEIQEPLNQFRELIEKLNQLIVECYGTRMVEPELGKQVLGSIQNCYPVLEKIEKQLTRYYHNIPYLLLLSPLVRLSNLDKKEVDALIRKVGIMIGRDKLMAVGDEASFENLNTYDALEILINLAFHDSQGGWKMQGVVTEKRQVSTIIEDRSASSRKKKWGII